MNRDLERAALPRRRGRSATGRPPLPAAGRRPGPARRGRAEYLRGYRAWRLPPGRTGRPILLRKFRPTKTNSSAGCSTGWSPSWPPPLRPPWRRYRRTSRPVPGWPTSCGPSPATPASGACCSARSWPTRSSCANAPNPAHCSPCCPASTSATRCTSRQTTASRPRRTSWSAVSDKPSAPGWPATSRSNRTSSSTSWRRCSTNSLSQTFTGSTETAAGATAASRDPAATSASS